MDAPVLTGSLPALVTPLTAERGLHAQDLTALIRRSLDDGASGVLVAGSTGEGALLEPDERERLVATARSVLGVAAAGGPLLLAGASAPTVAGLHADVGRLAAAGADVVLVSAPSSHPLSADEFVDLHLDVAEAASVPTLVHVAMSTGSVLTAPAVARLAQHDNVIGLKDSSPDAERRAMLIAAARPHAVAVCAGHAPTLVAALRAGAQASITAVANLRQRSVVAAHAAVADGDDAGADRLGDELTRIMGGLTGTGHSLPATIKAALQLEGVITERWCAPPLHSVPTPRLDRIRTAMLR